MRINLSAGLMIILQRLTMIKQCIEHLTSLITDNALDY